MCEHFHFSLDLMTCLFLWSVWGRGRFGSGPSVISGCWRHTRTPNHTTPNLEIEDVVDLGCFSNVCHKSQKSSTQSPWLIKTFTLDQTFRHRSSWFVSEGQLWADPPSSLVVISTAGAPVVVTVQGVSIHPSSPLRHFAMERCYLQLWWYYSNQIIEI